MEVQTENRTDLLEKWLENRIASMEKHLESKAMRLESRITSLEKGEFQQEESLASRFADTLSSVVGLKEALTGQRYAIKLIWAVMFCLGLAATIFYIFSTTAEYLSTPKATNVELQRPPAYDYPYLAVCPWAWFDVEKGMARGLTMDAIRYSLGYTDQILVGPDLDIETGREQFLRFYNENKYISLLHFYKDMATDLVDMTSDTMIPFAESNTSSYYCEGCSDIVPLEKVLVDTTMCYAFSFSAVDTKHYHSLSSPIVWMKMQDKSRIILKHSSNFRIFVMPDKKVALPDFSSLIMEPFTYMALRSTLQRFISLQDDTNPCTMRGIASGYSTEKCLAKCHGDLLKRQFGCYRFSFSANDYILHPSEFCNYFDNAPGKNISMWDALAANTSAAIASDEGAACVVDCPYPCNRSVVTSAMESKFQLKRTVHNMMQRAIEGNMTLLGINLNNMAFSQGGILTFTEVRTFSWSTLVSNVGGTLGLFVGGTLLTFVQLFMFCADYLLDISRRRVVHFKQANGSVLP